MNRITRIASAATVLGIGAVLLAGCPQDEAAEVVDPGDEG